MYNSIDGKTEWEVIIGLEVHAQIISKSKLFSGSAATFGAEPNSSVSFIDAGFPGVLPQPNKFCIEQAIKTGLALMGTINKVSFFDRKHYFYPDLPNGYQITQFYKPVMEDGYLNIELDDGRIKKIGIERLHIEQDAGKLLHECHSTKSFVDLNRAGVGLMEIVSMPDLRSKEEAAVYVNTIRTLLRHIGTCDGNMEEGSLRCDVNVSVRKVGEEKLRTRTEIKNINSVKFLQQAVDYEVSQHIATWERGEEVVQETKLFNSQTLKTYSLRKKEDAGDYRYLRDPDILPLILEEDYIEDIRKSLPELPQAQKERFISDYGLSVYDATLLSSDKEFGRYFEETLQAGSGQILIKEAQVSGGQVRRGISPKMVASWIGTNLFAVLNNEKLSISQSKITPQMLAELVALIENGTISTKIAKDIFEMIWKQPASPVELVEEKGLTQITDNSALEILVDELLVNNQDKVQQIRNGKDKLLGWFVGQIMQKTQGKANPDIVNSLLNKKIFG